MRRSIRALAPLAALALLRCASSTSVLPGPDAAATSDAPPAPTDAARMLPSPCAADDTTQGVDVVACGFAPALVLVGADEQAVYAMTADRVIYRVDTRTRVTTRLFADTVDSAWPLDEQPLGVRLQGGRIYLADPVTVAGGASTGVVAIDAAVPTQGAPSVLATGGVYLASEPIAVDAARVYWAAVDPTGVVGPLASAPLGGGPSTPLAGTEGAFYPVASRDGFLYFGDARQLRRVATAGGTASVVVPDTGASITLGDVAVGDAYAYLPGGADGYSLLRYPVGGGAAEAFVVAPRGGEIRVGAPRSLRIAGDALYFVQSLDDGTYAMLERVPLDGGAPAATVLQLQGLGAPVFDGTYAYVAYVRGGRDTPIEGVIGRVAR